MSNIIFVFESGAGLFGTRTTESDIDMTEIYLPKIEDLVLLKEQRITKIRPEGISHRDQMKPGFVETSRFPIQIFFKHLYEGKATAVEALFAIKKMSSREDFFNLLRPCLSPEVYMDGFIIDQIQYLLQHLSFDAPGWVTTKKNRKHLHHVIRLAEESIELHTTGALTFPRPNAKFLVDIKLNNFDPLEMHPLLIELREQHTQAICNSVLDYSCSEDEYRDICLSILRNLYPVSF